ncbi:hypothetical protein AMR42_03940 [Limnothrix sp. PR1529]|nr:hypothetical protein BCR12_16640 [Limnothrix sp. P13C2]PIB14848.1 hypothetical protein AMR42_03940 [Limnothrix sp. PR1529]
MFLVTAACASMLGAGAVAVVRSGEMNLFGIRFESPPILNWLAGEEQSFPPREGWPVSKTAEQELDPADPSIPDLVLQQIRSHPHRDSSAAIRSQRIAPIERPVRNSARPAESTADRAPLASPSPLDNSDGNAPPTDSTPLVDPSGGNSGTANSATDRPDRPDRSNSGDRGSTVDRSPSGTSTPEPATNSAPSETRPAPDRPANPEPRPVTERRPTTERRPAPEPAAVERRPSGGSSSAPASGGASGASNGGSAGSGSAPDSSNTP